MQLSDYLKQNDPSVNIKPIAWAVAVAAVLWGVMFSPWTAPHLNFWIGMTCSALVLITISHLLRNRWGGRKFSHSIGEVALGIVCAVALWVIFWICNEISRLIIPFAGTQVGSIYALRTGNNPWVVGAMLLLVIGPAEELFWRGTVQRAISAKRGPVVAFILTTAAYTLVHIWSFNLMLIGAAGVCGVFWGLLYAWRRNLTAALVSHCLWDVAVFLIFPIS